MFLSLPGVTVVLPLPGLPTVLSLPRLTERPSFFGPPFSACTDHAPSRSSVDADAPHSRPCSQAISRASSLHSLLGYQTKGIQYPQGRKYTPPIVQVKMSSPPDSDVSVVLPLEIPSPPDSEQGEISEPYYPQKASSVYPDQDPCCDQIKVDNVKGSRSQIYCEPHNYTSACSDPTGLRWKDGNSRQYKSTVLMMRSSSRDGLLI